MTRRRRGGAQFIPRPDGWRPGAPPPWAAGRDVDDVPLAPLLATLGARGIGRLVDDAPTDAHLSAVLVALFEGERGAEVVLTRRSQHLRSHRGEVSFPGGRRDDGETPAQAALREAHEEVALDPETVTIVGELDHLATVVSRNVIVPVVGSLDGRPHLVAASQEVERVLTVPLAELMRADTYREEHWDYVVTADGRSRPMHFFELDDETVWGATARILFQLLTIAARARSS